jgi:hypothetical protein
MMATALPQEPNKQAFSIHRAKDRRGRMKHKSFSFQRLGPPFPGCSTADSALVKAKRHQDAHSLPGKGLDHGPAMGDTQETTGMLFWIAWT